MSECVGSGKRREQEGGMDVWGEGGKLSKSRSGAVVAENDPFVLQSQMGYELSIDFIPSFAEFIG